MFCQLNCVIGNIRDVSFMPYVLLSTIIATQGYNDTIPYIFCQYLADVKAVQKLLQEVELKVSFVHKEEDFYNLEQTAYPEVNVIKDSSDVYHKLFRLILNWQHAESRCGFILMQAVLTWTRFFCSNHFIMHGD